jgi:hypothetical protein
MSLRLPLQTNITSGEIYFSFVMRVDDLGTSFTSVGTLAGLTTGTGTSFAPKINIFTNGAGGFNLGVSKSGGTTFGAWAPQNFNVGDIIFVVGRYTFIGVTGTDDTCDMWLNPSSSTFGSNAPPAPTIAGIGPGGSDLPQIDRVFFRSGGSTSSPTKLVVDELRVGFTWADVTTPAQPPLGITLSGTSVALSWPTNSGLFNLQGSITLGSGGWTTVPANPAVSGTNYSVSIPITNSVRFFRLSR